MLSKFLLFTHNDKNGLLAPNQAAHQAQPNHAKALQGNNQAAHTQVDPISQEGEPHPPNNSAPRCWKSQDERSFPCARLDVELVLSNPVLVSEEPSSHSERSAESLRLPRLITGSKRSTEHARGGEDGTTPSECLGSSSHVSKDTPLRTERAFKTY